jgi:hypothetical protein
MAQKPLNLDLDALLAGTVDDLADVPSIANWAPGAYVASLSMKLENNLKDKKTVGVKSTFVLKEVAELSNPDSTAPNPGDKFTLIDFLIHPKETVAEMGQGAFKEKAKVLNERFGSRQNAVVVEETQDIEVLIVTGLRTVEAQGDKPAREYMALKAMSLI